MLLPDPDDRSDAIAEWVSVEILPHEREARRWLTRSRLPVETDDIIQEAYARIAALDSVSHIRNGRGYFLATVRSLALQHLRRTKIIRMDYLADLALSQIGDDRPGPEAIVWSRHEIQRLILSLPERCRDIFHLCRIKGYTQKEAAEALGISENVVEKQIARAMEILTVRFSRDGDAS
ncbi:RNA polymerase sigma factor [Novosphingobium album (ex Liu et al. 2023)]|uniref:Sigma-70 family RNA polymerase sigma factor n=1 Tax=Novosphingobium album (ex Liu et al. 2023) TaxID=3031130 RepID=A0ABT5WRE0_9SPHN|nr:sigma-70 family RNA polymerase sigma factor [Novosphingobium album (ex Liu et al. 2023)]MDE8652560.1 sigma-70 family RNA polymerase sigma factor [Novosphingobium album (ex Liu et al. 2023)]